MRIVVDTNVLLVSIGRKSRHNWLFQAFLEERFTLLVSTEILLEYEEIITRRTRPEIAADVLKTLPRIPIFTCTKYESFEKILRHLATTRIHRLVIVEPDTLKVIGILSVSDIFSFIMQHS